MDVANQGRINQIDVVVTRSGNNRMDVSGGQPSPPLRNIATGPGRNVGAAPTAPLQFTCLHCDRSFSTKTGMGVHRRRAHQAEVNNEIVTERVKARWSEEETTLMAAEEVRLSKNGETHVNEPLSDFMPGRSLEAIKGKRRQAAYKALVQQLSLAIIGGSQIPPTGDTESFSTVTSGIESFSITEEVEAHGIARNFESTGPSEIESTGGNPVIESTRGDPEFESTGGNATPEETSEGPSILEFLCDLTRKLAMVASSRRGSIKALLPIASSVLDGEDVDEALTNWLRNHFKKAGKPKGPTHAQGRPYSGSRRNQRRERFARLQHVYERSRKDAARMVLQDSDTASITLPSKAGMLQYWAQVLSNPAEPDHPDDQAFPPVCLGLARLWRPITEDEVKSAKLRQGSACGPDGITAKSWSKVAITTRTLLYNILLAIGHLPSELKRSRTIFLAKKVGGSDSPSDFRPITICSVVTRQFHRILASRFTNMYDHKAEQSAYQHFDGVGKSVALLSTILDNSWRDKKELHIACLDAAKAFNSVSFVAITRTLNAIGCPQAFVKYIADVYTNVKTTLQFEGTEHEARVARGVLQGDPLSGPIFMAVFECAIQKLDPHVGFRTENCSVNAIAYADDIVLAASTRKGLQRNLDLFEGGLEPIGLCLNQGKSFTLSMVPSGKDKKVKVETTRQFKLSDGLLRPKGIDDAWKYLGLDFEGKQIELFDGKLPVGLERVSAAPLKPQQRLELLREHLVPGVLHRLVLGTNTAKTLHAADITIRLQVRKWLHLPHDVSLGYFYTPIKQGGLGLPCLQHIVPLLRLKRYSRIVDTMEGALSNIKQSRHVQSTLYRCMQALAFLGPEPDKTKLNSYWRARLVDSVDGRELESIGHHRSETEWLTSQSGWTRGEDFIHYCQIRINAIPSRDRTTRGRKGLAGVATHCRFGCRVPETTHHTIQTCHRSKGMRMLRHNRVVDLIESGLSTLGFDVTKERRLLVDAEGVRRPCQPDLIAVKGDSAWVIDAQVVGGQDVEVAHMAKVARYQGMTGLDNAVRLKHNVTRVQHLPCTVTWRGVWSKRSISELVGLGVPDRLLHHVITSVLRGSWMCWRMFNCVRTAEILRYPDRAI